MEGRHRHTRITACDGPQGMIWLSEALWDSSVRITVSKVPKAKMAAEK